MVAWIVFFLVVVQVVKVVFNWKVSNMLHPTEKVKLRPWYTGMYWVEDEDGIEQINASNFMFIYCNFVLFWLKIPNLRKGKVMAWSVLALTLLQIVIVALLISFGK